MSALGTLILGDTASPVTGSAWFDHQWGDFISVGGGGWDWFAVNLDDGTDITLSLVRDADGTYPLIYGTVVHPSGTIEHLRRDAFRVTSTGSWTSPHSGATYPAGWSISIRSEELTIDLTPTVAGQELDTRATTGVIYWEGSQHVRARRGPGTGAELGGQAYVELTGYASGGAAIPSPAPASAPEAVSAPPRGAATRRGRSQRDGERRHPDPSGRRGRRASSGLHRDMRGRWSRTPPVHRPGSGRSSRR